METELAQGEASAETLPVAVRDYDGRFLKGHTGNPAGRPRKDAKHRLTHLKQDLEIAIRESLSAARIYRIVNKMAALAEEGNVKAAKLILDKVISNADSSASEEEVDNSRRVVFLIENATFAAVKAAVPPATTPGEVIDVEVTPISPQEESK